ncbi:Protein serine/threonine kinase [Entamoeba marina]
MFSWLILLASFSYALQWTETNSGIISWGSDYSRPGWDVTGSDGSYVNSFIFNSDCCSKRNMEFDNTGGNNDRWSKHFEFTSDVITMTSMNIRNVYSIQQTKIITESMKNGIEFYLGCFNGDTNCRQSLSNTTVVEIYDRNALFFGDDVDQRFVVEFHTKFISSYPPLVFFGGIGEQSINVMITFNLTTNDITALNPIYYLFTTDEMVHPTDEIYYNENNPGYSFERVCNRNSIQRFALVGNNVVNPFICDCTLVDQESLIISNSQQFNYPDCINNSSTFDFILPTTESEFTFNYPFEWYSLNCSSDNQIISSSSQLVISHFTSKFNSIQFTGDVYIQNLTINTPNTHSFNVLNFNDIDYSSIPLNSILFTVQSISTDLESFNLKKCGNVVMYTLSLSCSCYSIDDYYVGFDQENDESCNIFKTLQENGYSLYLSSSYNCSEEEYWNELVIESNNTNIFGSGILSILNCEFENKTVTINSNLYCTTMNINSNTKLIINGELTINTLVITDKMNDNLNENGIIESYGSIQITSIEIATSQTNCFELISSNDSLSQPPINSYYSTLLLSQNHLLRICPSSNTNYNVQCTTIGNILSQESFDILHCPCIDSNCTINDTTTQFDTRNIEFNGIFNILTNSTIAISYKTSLFSIEYEEDKQILLIGNGAVGFETSLNSNSLKSETTTISIQSSNQFPCKALLIQYNNYQCIIEDNTTYPIVGSIENCQLQNGFGCEICYEYYESNITYCNECSSNCLRCYNGECINCEMNYQLNETNQCELIINNLIEIFDNNKTMKCNVGYYSNTNDCIKCSGDNCITCSSSQCLTCNNSFILNNEGNCASLQSSNGEEIISNYGVIDCNDSYYSNNSQCIDCSLTFGSNCEICNINGCLNCSNGVIINNGSCSLNTNCLNIDYSICLSCNDKGSWFNGNECLECGDNCKNCINGYCIECNDDYILQSENNCIDTNEYPDNCINLSYYGTCQRCSDGYYLNNNLCYECSNECTKCHNLTYCFECNDGYMLNDNNECVDMSESNANCKTVIPGSSGGCAICNAGYYREQTTCLSCISNCTKCNNGESCLICESDYFLLNDASECISYDDLTNCETKTQSGCTKCINSSYYLNNQYCTSCDYKTENCKTCNNNGECLTCQNGHILINYECINYQLIDNCKESSNSKCTSCSFWHTLNSDQTGCDTQVVWWVIVLIILFILIILIGICVLIWYVINKYLDHRKIEKQRKITTIFDMSRSNIQFIPTNNQDVVINKDEILFNDECEEIGVNEETRDLMCVGNTSKHTIKVQFSVKDECDKYEIRTNPQLITIPKGKAVEFEIFIKPLCTCKINDQIMLISVDLTEGKTITTPITINTTTNITTKLDYSELIEHKKVGEGGFGIVYKGTFRGNQVAIKKMKSAYDDEKQIEEFNKEVLMLDKFRNDYIVHFYGAVIIPHKICMVTEFAKYGSLQDLMNKRKNKPVDNKMKIKFLLDAAKGIQYIHSNGILHRDIKPDNILVIALDETVSISAKLTDFGASRNINMMMTNMTFTKGIGTPVYMAPEVLDQKKYKKSADIYSFAITIYETMIWGEAYPLSSPMFKFPWDIANFVTSGDRLKPTDDMNDKEYSLISNCWKQDPKERYEIGEVVKKLEEMN